MPPVPRPERYGLTGQARADYLHALECEALWRVREVFHELASHISGHAAMLLILMALEKYARCDADEIRKRATECESRHCAPETWPKEKAE